MDNSQPMRYAIYARYSSDLQRQSSLEDQIRKCDEHGKAQGWVPAKDCIYIPTRRSQGLARNGLDYSACWRLRSPPTLRLT